MSRNLKIFLVFILLTGVFTQDKICNHLGFGQTTHHDGPTTSVEHEKEVIPVQSVIESDSFVNEYIYRWDDQLLDWVVDEEKRAFSAHLVNYTSTSHPLSEPIEIDWQILMDIQYKLRYFEELGMEIYAPVFSKAVEALDGKEVIVEGHVIPFDQEEELLSLSLFPYASCFFCGKASPASIISMYLKDKSKRYKMDAFKKFRGTLHLNHDDPNQFYYILRDAEEEK